MHGQQNNIIYCIWGYNSYRDVNTPFRLQKTTQFTVVLKKIRRSEIHEKTYKFTECADLKIFLLFNIGGCTVTVGLKHVNVCRVRCVRP